MNYLSPGDERFAESAPAFTDEALALKFAERHDYDLRFVATWGKWVLGRAILDFDDTLHAYDLARACREVAAECNKGKIAPLASAKTVAAVERLASADRRLAATIDQWDADPWMLNTPMASSISEPGDAAAPRHDHQTKIAAVGPGGDCPRFLAFLDRIPGGDAELVAYLRRVLGYALTGDPRACAVLRLRHRRERQERVAVDSLRPARRLPQAAPIETFTASNGDRHPTDLASLRGARLVTATETEEGRRWAEVESSSSPAATRSRRGSCGRTSSNIVPRSSCSSPATISRRFARSTKPSGGDFTSSRSPSPFRPKNATPSSPRSSKPNGQGSSPG